MFVALEINWRIFASTCMPFSCHCYQMHSTVCGFRCRICNSNVYKRCNNIWVFEEHCLLGRNATKSDRKSPTFRGHVLPPFSWLKSSNLQLPSSPAFRLFLVGFFLFDYEDGDSTFLRNICELLSVYRALHARDYILLSHWCENLQPSASDSSLFSDFSTFKRFGFSLFQYELVV
jgi:hypothetical protein